MSIAIWLIIALLVTDVVAAFTLVFVMRRTPVDENDIGPHFDDAGQSVPVGSPASGAAAVRNWTFPPLNSAGGHSPAASFIPLGLPDQQHDRGFFQWRGVLFPRGSKR